MLFVEAPLVGKVQMNTGYTTTNVSDSHRRLDPCRGHRSRCHLRLLRMYIAVSLFVVPFRFRLSWGVLVRTLSIHYGKYAITYSTKRTADLESLESLTSGTRRPEPTL